MGKRFVRRDLRTRPSAAELTSEDGPGLPNGVHDATIENCGQGDIALVVFTFVSSWVGLEPPVHTCFRPDLAWGQVSGLGLGPAGRGIH